MCDVSCVSAFDYCATLACGNGERHKVFTGMLGVPDSVDFEATVSPATGSR